MLEDFDRCFRFLLAPVLRVNHAWHVLEALWGAALSAFDRSAVQRVMNRDAIVWIWMHHTENELLHGRRSDHGHKVTTFGIASRFIGCRLWMLRYPVSPSLHEFCIVFVLLLWHGPKIAGERQAHPKHAARPDIELRRIIGHWMACQLQLFNLDFCSARLTIAGHDLRRDIWKTATYAWRTEFLLAHVHAALTSRCSCTGMFAAEDF